MRRLVALAVYLAVLPVAGNAQSVFVYDYSLGYVGGSLTTHATLADAQAGTDAIVSNIFPQRDLALYLGTDAGFYNAGVHTFAYSLTNWFAVDLASSPSNTNVGFYQIADAEGGAVSSMTGSWDPSLTLFSFSAAGGPTIQGCVNASDDCGRLWNGAGSANGGSFIEWGVDFSAAFGAAATFNGASGLYESMLRPTSISGALTGIFLDGTTNQYYRLRADVNQVSWAFDQQDRDASSWLYAAEDIRDLSTVPEPATMTLLATGLAGMVGARRRRKAV